MVNIKLKQEHFFYSCDVNVPHRWLNPYDLEVCLLTCDMCKRDNWRWYSITALHVLYLIMGTIFSRNSLINSRRRSLLVPYVFNTTATCQSPILTNNSALRSGFSEGELYPAKVRNICFHWMIIFNVFLLFMAHHAGFSIHGGNKMFTKNTLSKRQSLKKILILQ